MATPERRLRLRKPPIAQNTEKVRAKGFVATKMTYKGDTVHEEEREEEGFLEATFTSEDPPATIRVGTGMTINLGNFESLRIDVAVTIPCHRSALDEAYEHAQDFVMTKMEEEQASWTGSSKKKGK